MRRHDLKRARERDDEHLRGARQRRNPGSEEREARKSDSAEKRVLPRVRETRRARESQRERERVLTRDTRGGHQQQRLAAHTGTNWPIGGGGGGHEIRFTTQDRGARTHSHSPVDHLESVAFLTLRRHRRRGYRHHHHRIPFVVISRRRPVRPG